MDMSHLFCRWTNSPKMKVFCSPSRLLIQTKLKISAQLSFSISGSSCSLLCLLYRLSFYLFRRVNGPQNPRFLEMSTKRLNLSIFEAIWKLNKPSLKLIPSHKSQTEGERIELSLRSSRRTTFQVDAYAN